MTVTWEFPEGVNQNPIAYSWKIYSGPNVSLLNIPIPIEIAAIYDEDYKGFWPQALEASKLTTLETGKTYGIVTHDPLIWTVGAAAPPPASTITWKFPGAHSDIYFQRTYTGNTISLIGTTMPTELSIVWNLDFSAYFIPGDPERSTFTSLEINKIYFVVATAPCTWVIELGVIPGVSEFKDLIAVYT